jgi:drug/metabolite transporter (DMT)-like permease
MLLAQALFLFNDGLLKLVGNTVPPNQVMAMRGMMAVYLTGAILVATINWRQWYLMVNPYVVLRALAEGGVAIFFLAALQHMQLNAITVISQVAPLILTVASALILGDRVGLPRWAAVSVGFVGVVLVAQPKGGISIHIVEALMVALLTAARDLITRYIRPEVPTNVVTFVSTLAVCLFGFADIVNPRPWVDVSNDALSLLAVSSVLVTLGIWFMVQAFRDVEVSVVSPFRYSAVVWGILYGFLILNEWPNELALLGAALIVISGVYAILQEARAVRSG